MQHRPVPALRGAGPADRRPAGFAAPGLCGETHACGRASAADYGGHLGCSWLAKGARDSQHWTGGFLREAGFVCGPDGPGGRAHSDGLAFDCAARAGVPYAAEAATAAAPFFPASGFKLDKCNVAYVRELDYISTRMSSSSLVEAPKGTKDEAKDEDPDKPDRPPRRQRRVGRKNDKPEAS